jgi:hypothetical protein
MIDLRGLAGSKLCEGYFRFVTFSGDYHTYMILNFLTELTGNYHYADNHANLLRNHRNLEIIITESKWPSGYIWDGTELDDLTSFLHMDQIRSV